MTTGAGSQEERERREQALRRRVRQDLGVGEGKAGPEDVKAPEQRANQELMALAEVKPGTVLDAARAEGAARRRRRKPGATGVEEQITRMLSQSGSNIPPPFRLALKGQNTYMSGRNQLLATARQVGLFEIGHWWLAELIRPNLAHVGYDLTRLEQIVDVVPSYEEARVAMVQERAAQKAEIEESAERRLETARTEKGLKRAQETLQLISIERARKELSARFAAQMGMDPGPMTYLEVADEMNVYIYLLERAKRFVDMRFIRAQQKWESSPDPGPAPAGLFQPQPPRPGVVIGLPVVQRMLRRKK